MKKILIIFYELLLAVFVLVMLPKVLYQWIIYRKYSSSLFLRFGFHYPIIQRTNAPLIWIHAVSMGETKAIACLARELKQQVKGCQLIISSATETGHAEAKRSLPFADFHLYLPLDFTWIVRPILTRIKPDLVVLCESDFWFNFLRIAKEEGAVIALANGKLSKRSMKRFNWIPFFSKALFNLFDMICVQNDLYKQRFIEAKAPADRLVITGNLKLDGEYPYLSMEEIQEWRKRLGIQPEEFVITVGSSHDPEEKMILSILQDIWKRIPLLKLILVPRHPERFKDVARLLEKEKIKAINFTCIHQQTGEEKVILMDTMGMLRMCYQLCDLALVGGSYTSKVGGHNILEPCWYGKPVIFGPHMYTQTELVDLIKQYNAGLQMDENGLSRLLEQWLMNAHERAQLGQRGLKLLNDMKGSTQRTLQALMSVYKN